MAYDLLLKNGRIADGSGMPSFVADLGVKDGKIVEIGKLSGPAGRVMDMAGLVVSPGFVDNNCHYDAQVTWDPLCTFSCFHGATTVVIGNCSLALSPVRPGSQERLAEFLSYSTRLLGYWVREHQIMTLEKAVRRLTFESASTFGIYDRGLLRPGMAADITIFDPETVGPLPEEVTHDFPAGGWRIKELAEGIKCTIVNGQVLIEDGRHTGALSGRVMRNALHQSDGQ